MNKGDLIKEMEKVVQPKGAARDAVEGILAAIRQALEQGDRVSVAGFGTFLAETRAARTVRNPRTGETMDLDERRVPKFVPGAALRRAVNGS